MPTPQAQASSAERLRTLRDALSEQQIHVTECVAMAEELPNLRLTGLLLEAQLAKVETEKENLRQLEKEIERIEKEETLNNAEDASTNDSECKAPSLPETEKTAGTGGTT
jgi:hypothetical protein